MGVEWERIVESGGFYLRIINKRWPEVDVYVSETGRGEVLEVPT